MARPRKEGMDYFPHDVNLSSDKKVEALRILHGNDGYTFYCITLELIYQERNFELDVSDAETIQILAKKVEVTTQKLEEMIKTSIKHGCFDRERYENDRVLTSNGIKKRASVVVDKREKMRQSYNSPKEVVSSAVSDAEMGVESTQSKRKVKEKKILYKPNVSLTEKEYEKLCADHNKKLIDECIDYLASYKDEKGYKTKSDNLTIRRWVIEAVQKRNVTPFKPQIVQPKPAEASDEELRELEEMARRAAERNRASNQ